jgi:23S rRNA pseudouridine2605 synthase
VIRLQKVLADRGVASRRHAEELIAAGRVAVEGRIVRELGTKVDADARIEVDGRAVAASQRPRYVALHKPRGIVSSARAERGRASVTDLVGARERLYPVGRLDVDSEGLVLLTNDGEWADRVLHPRYGHDREYEVDVRGPVTDDAVSRLRRGVRLEEGLARAERAAVVARDRSGGRLRLVLRTGWKRQVRRMCLAVGLRVLRLVRVRIGPLALGRLAPGTWRELTPREVRALAGSPRAGAA